jgi:hypothetical protein
MQATGSIRTATRWRSSSLVALVAVALGGCQTVTSTYYKPTEGQTRFSIDEARGVLDQVVATECPRLIEGGKDVGEPGTIELDVDNTGAVTQARVTRTLGDARLDAAFGGVAARLQIDAPPTGTPVGAVGRLKAGYACGAAVNGKPGSAVATLQPI